MLIQIPHSSLELPKASVAERKLLSLPTAQPPCCSAELVFQSLVFAAVGVVQDTQTSFLCVHREVLFALIVCKSAGPLTGSAVAC